jgi:putative copper resistance protein D
MSPDALSVSLRALSFVVLLQASGVATFVALHRPYLSGSGTAIRRFGLMSALIAMPVLFAQYLLEAARMADDIRGIFDPSLQRLAWATALAGTLEWRIAGVVLVACALAGVTATRAVLGLIGSAVIAVSFALMGHTSVSAWRPVLAPLLIIHVYVAAFWFGALPALYLVTRREAPDRAGRVIAAFSRYAIRLVPVLAIVGLVMSVILIRRAAVFTEPYGWLLSAKVIGFVALLVLASQNRSRLGPAVAAGKPTGFRRALTAEYVLIAAVLAATACMTTFFSPNE